MNSHHTVRSAHFPSFYSAAALLLLSLGATASVTVTFDNDEPGPRPNGFQSVDSSEVSFYDLQSPGAPQFGISHDTVRPNNNRVLARTDSFEGLEMRFASPKTFLSFEFAGDSPADTHTARLRLFRNGVQVGATVEMPSDQDHNTFQTIDYTGEAFDSAIYQLITASGRANIHIDNITFDGDPDPEPPAVVIDFETDSPGARADHFRSVDSDAVSFVDTVDADLLVGIFGTAGNGRALRVDSDDESGLVLHFSSPQNAIVLRFGNDDPAIAAAGDLARLTLFFEDRVVQQVDVELNRNGIADQTITYDGTADGVRFEAAFFRFVHPAGDGVPLAEVVDDIGFVGPAPGAYRVRPIARKGEGLPRNGAVKWTTLDNAATNEAGRFGVQGKSTLPGVARVSFHEVFSDGTFRDSRLALAVNEPVAHPAGLTLKSFTPPCFNANGSLAFRGVLAGSGVTTANDSAIFCKTGTELKAVAREHDVAPETGGARFKTFELAGLGDGSSEALWFIAKLEIGSGPGTALATGDNDRGLWVATAAHGVRRVLRERDAHTFGGNTRLVRSFTTLAAPLGHGGSFNADRLIAKVVYTDSAQALVAFDATEAEPASKAVFIATTGPDYKTFETPSIDSSGAVTAKAVLINNRFQLTRFSTDETKALVSQLAPFSIDGSSATLSALAAAPVVNDSGAFAAEGTLTGVPAAENAVIIVGSPGGENAIIAREGTVAPGTGGALFHSFGELALPAGRSVFFTANLRLAAGSVDASNRRGLWAAGPDGVFHLLVRTGLPVDNYDASAIDPVRSFTILNALLASQGQRRHFNGAGEIVCSIIRRSGAAEVLLFRFPAGALIE